MCVVILHYCYEEKIQDYLYYRRSSRTMQEQYSKNRLCKEQPHDQ